MSKVLKYCVDGTNLVRSAYGYAGPGFEEQEDADASRLIGLLDRLCEDIGPRLEIEVVFDGDRMSWGAGEHPGNLRIRFSHGAPADDLIIDRVRAYAFGGGKMTVVTADRELGEQAVEEGGRWQRLVPGSGIDGAVKSIRRRFIK